MMEWEKGIVDDTINIVKAHSLRLQARRAVEVKRSVGVIEESGIAVFC